MDGWLALSPLVLFLCVYLVSSIIASDFYKVPIAAAFLIASAYALLITRCGPAEQRIAVFSEGAGNKNVLLMIWIFVLAGAFAGTAEDMGAIDAAVNFALGILPGKFIYAGLFLASCFISMAIGTSVGTIVALVPMASGIAVETGMDIPFVTAIVAGGAFFGDNLSFISDTTIASTRTQGCPMQDKFKANLMIVAPAAVIVTAIYIVYGLSSGTEVVAGEVNGVKLVPYLLVIGLALTGMNVAAVLATGILANAVIGFACGSFSWVGWLGSVGEGIGSMGELIIVTMLAGGMLEIIRYNGGLDFIISGLTRHIKGKRGAEFSIAALVSIANLCTANNTIAIITTGRIARDITSRFGLDPRKTASILDTFSCLVQGLIPYGAQILMASGLSGASGISIIGCMYYPFLMGICAILAIFLRFPRKYSG
ncbi:MAG: Na+/H+ antiporter NhaC family protein [Bacteroidetes bacterium]|uniref:Na+/H+ antiporter NhaC family protein n=1 Tax=Candidatus Cryptobacteroides merdigallinarum TaxID=2840770 RepID=A0A9D9EJF6_9BACT|nr:Na+/H+ antiporter NhaC family protein [Candidatus Cryptobacteroides merdigallinarum]